MSLSSDDEEELDNTWVDNYKINEEKYNEFYNEQVNTIKVFFMYISNEQVVVNIKQEVLTLSVSGVLKREQLITLIKEKQYLHKIKYKLFSVVKYNIDLQPEEVDEFITVSVSDSDSNTISNSNTISVSDSDSNTISVSVSDSNSNSNSNTISDSNNYTKRFLIPENYINDIYFTDTISIFQDLNSLYILFKEGKSERIDKKNKDKNTTKKNKYTSTNKRYTRHKVY